MGHDDVDPTSLGGSYCRGIEGVKARGIDVNIAAKIHVSIRRMLYRGGDFHGTCVLDEVRVENHRIQGRPT